MEKELLELFDNVYEALDELMYSPLISCEKFRELDETVKTPFLDILTELKKE